MQNSILWFSLNARPLAGSIYFAGVAHTAALTERPRLTTLNLDSVFSYRGDICILHKLIAYTHSKSTTPDATFTFVCIGFLFVYN